MNCIQPNILIIDDDNRLRELLKKYLAENGFVVATAENPIKAREILDYLEFDLIILDGMMPHETGAQFLAKFRPQNKTPILMLTAMGEAEQRINGLELGADDYLVKPFEPKELLLRINSILKRSQIKKLFQINTISALTAAEQNLIDTLAANLGNPTSRAEIAAKSKIDERAVDVQITRLRKKLVNPNQIQTVRGEGYKLINQVFML